MPLWFICVHSAQEISTTNVMVYHHGVSLSEQHTIYWFVIVQSRICHTQVDMLISLHQVLRT